MSLFKGLIAAALLGALTLAPARAQDKVVIGNTQTATDIGLYVAHKKGYFREEGINAEFVNFDSAARMVTSMAGGDLQVIAGAASAALYNALARGVDIRIVADKVSTPPGRTSQTLIVRKDLIESGRYKTLADLRGMKIANAAPGTAASVTLYKMLEKAGLKVTDIEQTFLAFPQHVVALTNKAVAYPNHQIAVIFYSGAFATQKPEVARKFLKAFIRGVRDHNDALDANGRFVGDKGEEIIRILNEYTPIKDPQFYRNFPLAACNPDGTMNVASLKMDLEVLKGEKLIEGEVNIDKALDLSFLNAVIKELGPYKKAN